jgi:hypothetical protein
MIYRKIKDISVLIRVTEKNIALADSRKQKVQWVEGSIEETVDGFID